MESRCDSRLTGLGLEFVDNGYSRDTAVYGSSLHEQCKNLRISQLKSNAEKMCSTVPDKGNDAMTVIRGLTYINESL